MKILGVMKNALFTLLFFLMFLQASSAMGQFFFFQHPLEEKEAPDFVLKTTRGQTVRMSEYRDGKPGLVFFWATWCPHCRTQLKELYARKDELEGEGIKLILVDIQEPRREVVSYLDRRNIDFEIFLDEDAVVADQYSIIGIPSFFFINPDGQVVAVKNFLSGDYLRFFEFEEKNQENGFSFSDSTQ